MIFEVRGPEHGCLGRDPHVLEFTVEIEVPTKMREEPRILTTYVFQTCVAKKRPSGAQSHSLTLLPAFSRAPFPGKVPLAWAYDEPQVFARVADVHPLEGTGRLLDACAKSVLLGLEKMDVYAPFVIEGEVGSGFQFVEDGLHGR